MPGVTAPIIDFFIHPPFGALTTELIIGSPFLGGTHAFDRPRGPIRVDAYGLLWSTSLVALGVGSTPGLITEYEDRVIELSLTYQLLDGSFIQGQRVASNHDIGIMLFEQLLPYGVDCIIGPPFGVDLYWLLAL